MTADQCVEMINHVIFYDEIGGFALGEKTSGNYGTRSDGARCSVDGLIWKADRTFVDGIADAGGRSTPTWQVRQVGEINPGTGQPYKPFPGKLIQAIDPADPDPDPPDPPDPPPGPQPEYVTFAQLALILADLKHDYDALIDAQDTRIDALESRITALENASTDYVLVSDPNAPPIDTSRDFGHRHEIRARVVNQGGVTRAGNPRPPASDVGGLVKKGL